MIEFIIRFEILQSVKVGSSTNYDQAIGLSLGSLSQREGTVSPGGGPFLMTQMMSLLYFCISVLWQLAFSLSCISLYCPWSIASLLHWTMGIRNCPTSLPIPSTLPMNEIQCNSVRIKSTSAISPFQYPEVTFIYRVFISKSIFVHENNILQAMRQKLPLTRS
jgi:hypothetical protein